MRFLRVAWWAFVPLAAAGCSARGTGPAASSLGDGTQAALASGVAAAEADTTTGVIVAVRPIRPAYFSDTAGTLAAVLPPGPAPQIAAAPAHLVELVVRDRDGHTVTVVETDQPGLAAGARVTVRSGRRVRVLALAP